MLKEMATRDTGRLTIVNPSDGYAGEPHRRHHHAQLLVDVGHAEWLGDKRTVARITNAGYDFLNAATNPKSGESAKTRFVDLFNSGVSYARAAQAAVELAAKATIG